MTLKNNTHTNSENGLRKLEAKLETNQEELAKANKNIIDLTEEKETLLEQLVDAKDSNKNYIAFNRDLNKKMIRLQQRQCPTLSSTTSYLSCTPSYTNICF